MSPSRRIYLYWALLLIPTLVAGGVALQLLQREQARLASRSGKLDEARLNALATRARLVVENLELTAGDVEIGLLDSLAETPENLLGDFLQSWPEKNPLVRTAFLCAADGSLLIPAAADSTETARGFRRRFEPLLRSRPPWQGSSPTSASSKTKESHVQSYGTASANDRASSTETQPFEKRLAKIETAPDFQPRSRESKVAPGPQASAPGSVFLSAPSSASVSSSSLQSNSAQVQNVRRDVQQLARANRPAALSESTAYLASSKTMAKETPSLQEAFPKDLAAAPAPRGWSVLSIGSRRHVLGWFQPAASSPIRGLELDLSVLIPRLQALLPSDLAAGENIALLDEQGRVLHQTGAHFTPGSPPVVHLPVGSTLLSGWSIEARLADGLYSKVSTDGSFLLVGSLLVGTFAISILAGGSLLLWQARSSALEALQKTSFVSNVSHEFKTPLTTIRLYAELLEQKRVADPEKRAEYLRTISRETQRLARLVGNVLDFSRLEQGRKQYRPEALDLSSEVARILDAHQPRLAEAGLSLRFTPPSSPLPAFADRDAFEQILLNLLDNACKYAASGREISVSLLASSSTGSSSTSAAAAPEMPPLGCVDILLADRGPGVPADQRERIFEKFHRVDDRLTAEQSGAGLGLSIARRLARDLRGDLVCLDNPGGGALFRLRLPSASSKDIQK